MHTGSPAHPPALLSFVVGPGIPSVKEQEDLVADLVQVRCSMLGRGCAPAIAGALLLHCRSTASAFCTTFVLPSGLADRDAPYAPFCTDEI